MGVRVVFPDMGKDPSIQLIEKTITENGTYDAITDGANGYSKVNVNVEGGGGSSDFSTANVTIINNTGSSVTLDFININQIDDDLQTKFSNRGGTKTAVAVLYKGQTAIDYTGNVSVTGNAEADENGVLITGDCTITIS